MCRRRAAATIGPMKRAHDIAIAATALFVVDLFLPWQRVGLDFPGVLDIRNTSMGWAGWGALAGICAIVLLILMLARYPISPLGRATLSVALVVFTGLAVLVQNAHMSMGAGMMRAQVDTTLWPAWVGLGLAVVAAAATLAPLISRPEGRSQPHPA